MPARGTIQVTTSRKLCGVVAGLLIDEHWLLPEHRNRTTLLTSGEPDCRVEALRSVLSRKARRSGPDAFSLSLERRLAEWAAFHIVGYPAAGVFVLGAWVSQSHLVPAVFAFAQQCAAALSRRHGGHNKLPSWRAEEEVDAFILARGTGEHVEAVRSPQRVSAYRRRIRLERRLADMTANGTLLAGRTKH